jgi:ketosteroid isomerase-like protein
VKSLPQSARQLDRPYHWEDRLTATISASTSTMTFEEQERVARKFLSVLGQPDVEVIKSVAVEDVVWTYPGSSRISGEACGIEGVMARAKRVASYGVKVEILRTVYGLGGLALLQHNVGERNGVEFDEDLVAVFSFRGNKISRLDVYLSDVKGAERFFT